MNTLPRFPLMDEWTPDQALAVYEFCNVLAETLWNRYEDVLFEQMIRSDRARGFHHYRQPEEQQSEQPLDDELPF